jgi:hypothetical protein
MLNKLRSWFPNHRVLTEKSLSVNKCITIEQFKLSLVRTLFSRVSLDVTSKIYIKDPRLKSLNTNSATAVSGKSPNILFYALTLNEIATRRMFFQTRLRRVTVNSEGASSYLFLVDNESGMLMAGDMPIAKISDVLTNAVADDTDIILKPLFDLSDIDDAVVAMYSAYKGIVKAASWNNKSLFMLDGLNALLATMHSNDERSNYLQSIALSLSKESDKELLVMDAKNKIAVNSFDYDSIEKSSAYALQKLCMITGIPKNVLTGESPNSLNGASVVAQDRLTYEVIVQSLIKALDVDLLSFYMKKGVDYWTGSSMANVLQLIELAEKTSNPIAKDSIYDIIIENINANKGK